MGHVLFSCDGYVVTLIKTHLSVFELFRTCRWRCFNWCCTGMQKWKQSLKLLTYISVCLKWLGRAQISDLTLRIIISDIKDKLLYTYKVKINNSGKRKNADNCVCFSCSSLIFCTHNCYIFMFCFTATTKQVPSQFEEIGSSLEVLELDRNLEAACLFVRETAREVGFKFPPQEITPGILFCAAERVLLEVQDPSDL
jgi:hypothetical protein